MAKPQEFPVKTYPSVRHHASGVGTYLVRSEEEEMMLKVKEPDTWFDTPQPKPIPPPPEPEPTIAELVARIESLKQGLTEANEIISELAAALDHPKIQKLIGG